MVTKADPITGKRQKTGGRLPGQKNRHNRISKEVKELILDREYLRIEQFLDKNMTPLTYLFNVFNDTRRHTDDRIKAAIASLPYVHGKKPAQMELSGRDGKDLNLGNDRALRTLDGLLFDAIKQIDADDELSNAEDSNVLHDKFEADSSITTEYAEITETDTQRAEAVLQQVKDSK